MTLKQRFLKHVNKKDGCWEWTGHTDKDGYGKFRYNGNQRQAHRVSFIIFKEKVGNKQVCHSCDNPSCVNPNHLWLGTQSENIQDMWNKGRRKMNPCWKSSEKPVLQMDKKENEINEFKSISEASRKTGIHDGSICSVCKNKRKTAGGYKWRYLSEKHTD